MKKRLAIGLILILFLALSIHQTAVYADGAISDNLVSCWNMDETSGTRADSYGGNTLTDNNTVQVASGKMGNAALFDKSNNESFSHADNASLSMGDISFTIMTWLYRYTVSTNPTLIKKGDEFMLQFTNNVYPYFYVVGSGGGAAVASTTVTPTNEWYMVLAIHNATADQITVRVNASAPNTAADSYGSRDTAYAFQMGDIISENITRIDTTAIWKRALSEGEQSWLYNNGVGRSCSEIILNEVATATPGSQVSIDLSSGDTAILTREINFGDIAIVGIVCVVLIVILILGIINVTNLWFNKS